MKTLELFGFRHVWGLKKSDKNVLKSFLESNSEGKPMILNLSKVDVLLLLLLENKLRKKIF